MPTAGCHVRVKIVYQVTSNIVIVNSWTTFQNHCVKYVELNNGYPEQWYLMCPATLPAYQVVKLMEQ